MNYDYVIRFEKLAEDSNFLLHYLQKNDAKSDRIFFDTNSTSYVDKKMTVNTFSTFDQQITEKLLNIYENDFNVMGYAST